MYVLLIPALMPFFLLGTVLGLARLEDRLLPPQDVEQAPAQLDWSSHAEPAAPRPAGESRRAA